jgi:hypothetical protein
MRLHQGPEFLGLLVGPVGESLAKNRLRNLQRPKRTRQMVMVDDVDLLSRAQNVRYRLFLEKSLEFGGR